MTLSVNTNLRASSGLRGRGPGLLGLRGLGCVTMCGDVSHAPRAFYHDVTVLCDRGR